MSLLDLARLQGSPLQTMPFDYCIVPEFVTAEALARLRHDFPMIRSGGSFPLSSLSYGPAFQELSDELTGPAMCAAIEDKFEIDLSDRPSMLTVRGRTRWKDGDIHCDSKTKLITVLLYLNETWEAPGGRLRLLRSSHDLNDCVAEVAPEKGTLLAFRCSDNAWHGHAPFVGERRSLQLNWLASQEAANHGLRRHQLSAFLKKLNPFSVSARRAA
jgi:hypothetical protein